MKSKKDNYIDDVIESPKNTINKFLSQNKDKSIKDLGTELNVLCEEIFNKDNLSSLNSFNKLGELIEAFSIFNDSPKTKFIFKNLNQYMDNETYIDLIIYGIENRLFKDLRPFVENMVRESADINNYLSVIEKVITENDSEMLFFTLDNFKNIHTDNDAILRACYGLDLDTYKIMFEKYNFNPLFEGEDGETFIFNAVKDCDIDLFNYLIDKYGSKIDLLHKNNEDKTVFHYLCEQPTKINPFLFSILSNYKITDPKAFNQITNIILDTFYLENVASKEVMDKIFNNQLFDAQTYSKGKPHLAYALVAETMPLSEDSKQYHCYLTAISSLFSSLKKDVVEYDHQNILTYTIDQIEKNDDEVNSELLKIIITYNPDLINKPDSGGNLPLWYAKSEEVTKILKNFGATESNAYIGKIKSVFGLVKNTANIEVKKETVLDNKGQVNYILIKNNITNQINSLAVKTQIINEKNKNTIDKIFEKSLLSVDLMEKIAGLQINEDVFFISQCVDKYVSKSLDNFSEIQKIPNLTSDEKERAHSELTKQLNIVYDKIEAIEENYSIAIKEKNLMNSSAQTKFLKAKI